MACLLSLAVLFAALPLSACPSAKTAQGYPPEAQAPQPEAQAPPPGQAQPGYAQQTPEQLQQLVAPIALYPDSLVAQILAASTFPDQIVEADRWLQQHPDLKGKALADAADQQPWDASVKALTAFPAVLGNMDKNLSWTSSLGDAYYNQEQNVMDAIQVMRQRAEQAGNLKSTPQQTVSNEGQDVVIQPASPDVVYVPAFDPWTVYGAPILAWPGWYPYPGIWFGGPYISFGVGFGVGFFGGFGWGWPHWGFDWHHHFIRYGGDRYFSRSRVFYNRGAFYRGGGPRGFGARPFHGNARAARGFAAPHGESGIRSGAFSGIDRGGETRGFSARGHASFGGGHGGGFGGGHGFGGGRGGGGHR